MQVFDPATTDWKHYQHPREGTLEVIPMGRGSADGVNYNLTLTRYGSDADAFVTPRHHHTFEQVRAPLVGDLNYGPGEEVPEGWLSYFPAGAPYGPQRVSGGIILLLQFGTDYLTSDQYKRAHAALEQHGRFEGGDYHDTDPATGAARAIAWFIPNREGLTSLDPWLVSVADLERLIGADAVRIDAPDAVKAMKPAATWPLPAGCSMS